VKNRHLFLSFVAIVAMVAIVFSSCKKINEATELGGGVIPTVDNINTFDTTITVQAYQNFFNLSNDSQYLAKNELFYLGKIARQLPNGDQFFGATDARMFFELKPPFYKYSFANKPDSLFIDSVVLVLNYVESYGDTNTAQTVNVFELDPSNNNNFRSDSSYLIRQNSLTYSSLLGSKTFFPKNLKDSVKAYKDTTTNQLRIRLGNSFGARLLSYDSTGNGAYSSDSLFKTNFKGFALQSMSTGNAVMGFDLTGANTKLAIYYKYEKRVVSTVSQIDTAVAYFSFSGICAAANYIQRDYSGTPAFAATQNGTAPDPVLYIQGSPGTFAEIKIPALGGLNNRVIHRAELIVEQLYDASDTVFRTPEFLYLDASDPTIIASNYKFRTIPYDLSFTQSGALNLGAFGCVPTNAKDDLGNPIKIWKFNISRYVQHILTGTQSLYNLRLSAPFTLNEQFGIPPGTDQTTPLQVNPTIVKGRVRLVGNSGANDNNPHRIRLRLIYSKI
jgi:Domain of unknown function (DUF4270)